MQLADDVKTHAVGRPINLWFYVGSEIIIVLSLHVQRLDTMKAS